ncbi:hypothetical protein OH77DRAFT_824809 [Trametes cingulata]|nr:hypothetical protein OH77DRAFT_824809 [Trametes cingulata]
MYKKASLYKMSGCISTCSAVAVGHRCRGRGGISRMMAGTWRRWPSLRRRGMAAKSGWSRPSILFVWLHTSAQSIGVRWTGAVPAGGMLWGPQILRVSRYNVVLSLGYAASPTTSGGAFACPTYPLSGLESIVLLSTLSRCLHRRGTLR